MNNRAGIFINQPNGYRSFKPEKLPPNPPVDYLQMISLLSEADRKLGRLDGITQILPNPELFVAMYVQKEAVLSSQIEGTQASLSDVLENNENFDKHGDIAEVINYVNAMNFGLNRLNEDFPLCLRLIREIHEKLLENGRGSDRNPGEFRTTQNWRGPSGCSLSNARFVPPAVPDMLVALSDLENFFYEDDNLPALIKIALIHAQFESIHPFLDGNGRMGRLLITFWLCNKKILSQPLLYLSYYFKKNRLEYYDRLMAVREKGDWEGWIRFFLQGVSETSDEATNTAREIIGLKSKFENEINRRNLNNTYFRLLEYLFDKPYVNRGKVAEVLAVSYPTAGKAIDDFCEMGILQDITLHQKRNKKYAFVSYLSILNRGTEL